MGIAFRLAGLPGAGAQAGAGEGQLAAGRAVGGIAQEIEAEQRVVVEHVHTKRG